MAHHELMVTWYQWLTMSDSGELFTFPYNVDDLLAVIDGWGTCP
jgi:hypothetical protein